MSASLLEALFDGSIGSLHFVRPAWLLGIVAALALAWLWARRARRLSRWESRIDPPLLGALLEARRTGGVRGLPWILAAALSLGAVGLAGPAWERLPQPVEQRSDAVVVLLDLSLSMFAEDVPPSRLVRARQKVADILRLRREGFTALVAYAGNAHTVVPLTEDARTIENLLPALSPDMMPLFGSDVGAAIELAHQLFANAGIPNGLILVITDGIDRIADATERRDASFPISILGIGTADGGNIPLRFTERPGEILRTRQGEPVVARFDEQRLQDIAGITHGRYHPLTVDDADVLYLLATPTLDPDATRQTDRRFDLWADQGFWLAIALLPVLLLGFRRGIFLLLPLMVLPAPADAGIWDDLWLRPDQQAYRALQEGQPEHAAALFEDPAWRAAALYRSGEYARAADAYADAAQPSAAAGGEALTALYNEANARARLGDYQGAIARYDAVLARDPSHDDARANRALLDKLLEQQSRADPDAARNQAPQSGSPDEGARDPRADENAQTSQEQADAGSPTPGQRDERNGDSDADGAAPEQPPRESEAEFADTQAERDALEQWLRRVPDDPGGLLRRKFQYETNQRLRQGEIRARDPEKIW